MSLYPKLLLVMVIGMEPTETRSNIFLLLAHQNEKERGQGACWMYGLTLCLCVISSGFPDGSSHFMEQICQLFMKL